MVGFSSFLVPMRIYLATRLPSYTPTPLQSYTPTIKQASGKTEGCPKWHPVGWLLVIIFFARAI